MARRVSVDNLTLVRWRHLDACLALAALAEYAKRDSDFAPVKDPKTQRWHALAGSVEFDLLLTGPKFYDASRSTGGCGAIDLTCHIFGCDFAAAVRLLKSHSL
jgi:hypothetical protein